MFNNIICINYIKHIIRKLGSVIVHNPEIFFELFSAFFHELSHSIYANTYSAF